MGARRRRKRVTADRTADMDAQWHNLRAVVPTIRVDLIVSVRQPTLINAPTIDFFRRRISRSLVSRFY